MVDQAAEGLLSPFLKERRFKAARPYLRKKILDIGCGSGGLAALVKPENYIGVDRDELSLSIARRNFPDHTFMETLPSADQTFDTIVALAIIEHIENRDEFMLELKARLRNTPDAAIILTTPHPSVDWVHTLGAKFGLFSKHGSEEHGDLLNHKHLQVLADNCDLKLSEYHRFLLRANQLAIYKQM